MPYPNGVINVSLVNDVDGEIGVGGGASGKSADCWGESGLSVSSPESSSSSSQDSATGCFFLNAADAFDGCGCRESWLREVSSAEKGQYSGSFEGRGIADLWVLPLCKFLPTISGGNYVMRPDIYSRSAVCIEDFDDLASLRPVAGYEKLRLWGITRG